MNQAIDISWTASGGTDEAVLPVRGRAAEQERITQWVRRLIHRRAGGVLWIEGPADVGKSRMLACAADEAAWAGARVLVGAGLAGGEMAPLAPLLDALTHDVDDFAHGLRIRSFQRNVPYWLVQEIRNRLRVLTRDQPVALLLDDLQDCDELTLLTVRTLTVQLADLPVLWVLAARAHGERPAVEALRRNLLTGRAAHLELLPLAEAAVREMAQDLLGSRAVEAAPYLGYLDGLPGAVRHVCAYLASEPPATGPGSLGTPGHEQTVVAAAVSRRLNQLSDDGRQLVQITAVLGESLSARHLARVLGRSESALLRPLREVLAARLLSTDEDRLAFRHALVRQTVSATLPRPVRQSVRRRSVDLQLRAGVPAASVAAELGDVAEPGDTRALEILRTAARELAPVSPCAAVGHLRRAVALAQGVPQERQRLAAELIPLLWQVGEVGQARDLAHEVLQAPPDPVAHAEACLQLVRMGSQFRLPRPDMHLRFVHRRRDVPVPLKDQLLSMTLLSELLTGDAEEAGGGMSDALMRTRGVHAVSELTLRTVQSMSACHRQNWGDALKHSDGAVANIAHLDLVHGSTLPEVALSTSWHASVLSLAGHDRAALELVDDGLRAAEARGRRAFLPLWRTARARLLLDAGRLADAAGQLAAAEALVATTGLPSTGEASALCTLVQVARRLGDEAAMEKCVTRADAYLSGDDPHQRRVGAWLTVVTAAHRVERMTPEHLSLAAACLQRGFVHALCADPGDVVVLVRVALHSGQRDIATATVEFAEHRARRNPGFALFQAAAAHARGLLDGDRDRLLTATELYGDARPLLKAGALADTGELMPEAGEARTCFEQALELYDSCGAHQESGHLRNRLRKPGIRSAGAVSRAPEAAWRGLTPAELGVVRLIAHGATNREAAQRLFLSPHTVNTHLRHAFDKLGVRSRVQLARLYLREVDQPGEESRDGIPAGPHGDVG
ncbi:response regulator transcription factor [Streptomyces sp. NPDC052016]|uniref:response regulator transcription factor n=1 Tax=Streptomyces sp. NPDC052016 TaxID=3365680 RepID=UPI0037CFF27B